MRVHLTLLVFLLAFSTILTAQMAPDFTLTTTDGAKFALYEDHLNQGKTVVLEIFFVDCPPCRQLAPHMGTLHKSLVERSIAVEFISISISTADDAQYIGEFKKEFSHDWSFVSRSEESQEVLKPYQDGTFGTYFGTPTTLVIAPDGEVTNVRGRVSDGEDWAQKLEDQIIETQTAFNDNNEEPVDPPPAMAIVTGGITTTKGDGLEGVTINFSGAKDTSIVSGAFGNFQTGSLLADERYTVSLEKNDDVTNGVTTLDIVLASKHILGIDEFSQDFETIAADVNKSGSVTTFDLVLMRQVILGSRTDFPGNPSWVFEPSEVEISSLQDLGALAFTAIKIGDINQSADPNGLLEGTDRNNFEVLNIATVDQVFKAGAQVDVILNGTDFRKVQGFQFTLDFDAKVLKLNDLGESDLVNFSLENANLKLKEKGLISTSWNGKTSVEHPALFKLSFTALANGTLSEILSINSAVTKAEGYNLANDLLDVDLSFGSNTSVAIDGMVLYPNPSKSDKLFLNFENTQAQKITVRLSNINGQTVRNFSFDLAKGAQVLSLSTADLKAGVYLVQILSNQQILETARLIKQ